MSCLRKAVQLDDDSECISRKMHVSSPALHGRRFMTWHEASSHLGQRLKWTVEARKLSFSQLPRQTPKSKLKPQHTTKPTITRHSTLAHTSLQVACLLIQDDYLTAHSKMLSTTSSISSVVKPKPIEHPCGESCECCGIGESCSCAVM